MQIIEKVKGAVVGFYDEIVLHWNRPAKGNYVSYKELVNYALAQGMQVKTLNEAYRIREPIYKLYEAF